MNDKENILGNKIKCLRKSRGWTQELLAEKIGIDNKHLSRIEKGYHMPNYQIIKKLAKIFNFDIRTFEDLPLDNIDLQDSITSKSIKILNSAKNNIERQYYFDVLKQARKGLKIGAIEDN